MSDVLICEADGPSLRTERDAVDLVGEAGYLGARWVVVPAGRLHEDFWRLSTRVAGDFVQKFTTYGRGLAIMGDISAYVAASESFRDWVREANRGRHIWFVADLDELHRRRTETGT